MIAAIILSLRLHSFKDYCDYALHDRRDQGKDRVVETKSVNLFSIPEQARKEMQVKADAAKTI